MFLSNASWKIQAITGSAADIETTLDYADLVSGSYSYTPDVLASIVTAATTDILTGPASGVRKCKRATFFNNHASTATVLTIQRTDGTDTDVLWKGTLQAGERVDYEDGRGWKHYDSNGGEYPSVGNAATQAEMEAGTASDKYVTPQGVNWHPGVSKFWVKAGVTGNILASWNVTSLTDNGTGDITVTIATDFSSADYCAQVSVEMTATTYGVANTREPHIRFGGQAAGTLRCDCVDNTATTSLIKDPTFWHISGLGDQ